jgi:predicted transglutaminase-like cysteine proteinase
VRTRRALLAGLLAAALWAVGPPATTGARAQAANGLFGSLEFSSGNLSALPHWVAVMERIRADRITIDACDRERAACPTPRVRHWRQQVASLAGSAGPAQLSSVNLYINTLLPYLTDYENYGVSDYWAAPLEFLRRSGDCEDYAITKFVSLLDLGFANDDMRIVVVQDEVRNLAHAVLAVQMDGRALILDSLIGEVREDHRLPQYVPQYSVNLDTRWTHIMR